MINQKYFRMRKRLIVISKTILTIIVSLLFLFPLLWLIMSSFKLPKDMYSFPVKLMPTVWRVENYIFAFTRIAFLKYLYNSIILGLIYTLPSVFFGALYGYSFAKLRARGKEILFTIILSLMMIPIIVTLIPQYILLSRLKLIGTYWIWLLWGVGGNPLYIFLYKQFFTYIPKDLEDSAIIDGCNHFTILWKIYFPLSKPILVTVSIFSFLWVYGSFIYPLILLTTDNTTLAVAMTYGYRNEQHILLVPILFSGIVMYTIPIIVIFFMGQKYYVQGLLSSSGLKG